MKSKYFTSDELTCHCGCGGTTGNKRLYELLDKIRESVGVPVIVLSGYRCPEHNREVGGASQSQHVEGTAADLTYEGIDVDKLGQIAEECGADGIGLYWSQEFVHVDVRGYQARWDENNA